MVQLSLATKSQSFDLVKVEIEQTIKHAEASLERFQENRENGEDLQNCVDYLNQLRGIFVLVELRGGTLLCQEAVAAANELPVGASDEKNSLLTALSSALFILRRYMEYYQDQRVDHPELLLPILNDLRNARLEKPYPESCFFDIDSSRKPDFSAGLSIIPLSDSDNYAIHARRMRLMYQVGLLGILRERDARINARLIGRAARGFARLCYDAEMGQLWCLLAVVTDTMGDSAMGFNKSRKQLLMRIERYTREIVQVGKVAASKNAPDSLFLELIYILYCSDSVNPEVTRVLEAYDLRPTDLPEHVLEEHRKRLYGPGADVLASLSNALQEELIQLKDRVDIIERGIEPDQSELGSIATMLDQLANTLVLLDLMRLSRVTRREATKLRQWEAEKRMPDDDELYQLANAVLSIEDAALQLTSRGITCETDMLAETAQRNNTSICLREAMVVVAGEAKAALILAKRAITAYIESNYDKLHLASLPSALHSIWGGFVMLEDEPAANVLARIADGIQRQLMDSREPPSDAVLEALADALMSLEYYIESIGTRDENNLDLLELAETSLTDVAA